MSKPWVKTIPVPENVKVDIKGNEVAVTGPKGTLSYSFHTDMSVNLSDGTVTVSRPTDSKEHRTLLGVTGTLIANIVHGVHEGFQKRLQVVGVGYRAQASEGELMLRVGYAQPVEITPPQGVSVTVEENNVIVVSGIDKELVGGVAAKIREVRPPDAYKGKGIRYADEELHLKPGKAGKIRAKG